MNEYVGELTDADVIPGMQVQGVMIQSPSKFEAVQLKGIIQKHGMRGYEYSRYSLPLSDRLHDNIQVRSPMTLVR